MEYSELIDDCRADRDRFINSIKMIDDGMLTHKTQEDGRLPRDATPDYRAHLVRIVAELDILINQYEAEHAQGS